MTIHWAEQYIGIPWKRGATGPDTYDCLAFTEMIERKHFDTIMDVGKLFGLDWRDVDVNLLLATTPEYQKWLPASHPLEGDVVLMSYARDPIHIGVWINANRTSGVLHCSETNGVVFQTMSSLRRVGWGGFSYYTAKCKLQ